MWLYDQSPHNMGNGHVGCHVIGDQETGSQTTSIQPEPVRMNSPENIPHHKLRLPQDPLH